MSRRTVSAAFMIFAASAVSFRVGLASPRPTAYAERIKQSDLVVRGSIVGISRDEVPVQDLFPGDPRPDATRSVLLVDLRILEVLKGQYSEEALTVVVPEGGTSLRFNYAIGNEVILSLIYWKYMRGGSFVVMNDGGRFLRVGDLWENQERVPYGEKPSVVPLSDIRDASFRSEPLQVAKSAVAIVLGTIGEVEKYRLPSGALIENVTLRVTERVSGSHENDVIRFRVVRSNGDGIPWKTRVPKFEEGEQWLLYLGRDADGYFALDGTNGLFRVEGDALIQADRVRIQESKRMFIREMTEVIGDE